ncbi:hypothetical protein DS909_13255 [Phaeobacter gallaeciensis]|uniref:Chalcone isomerase domain-containing protein n=2 Tax=Roseobacteraceae TaxID=2854170 RepID=A0A366X0N8_9RHOB|nr:MULTISPECIES: hypothetical protein [Roseobacteraceae]MBT3142130.1 hypothetical protein [Falsiruegeria litorea]MBT8168525.1 hypothetical protein [Falsiruegeria litorea]RBW53992.1 hypothetical protein DS909_13255 [Phaeobacter gallaeciensis]
MRKLALLFVTLLFPLSSQASTINSALPGAELRGAATFRFIGFPLYEARLFTKSGAPLDWSKDFGLELKYLRNLTEYDLVEGTMRELNRTGTALPLRGQLEQCFDDVRNGDRYIAVSKGQNQIGFWLNGSRVCTLKHPQIKTRFMTIFLGDNTRSESFTRKLKGE